MSACLYDLASLALVCPCNDLHHVSSLYVHWVTHRLSIFVELIVFPLLSWALQCTASEHSATRTGYGSESRTRHTSTDAWTGHLETRGACRASEVLSVLNATEALVAARANSILEEVSPEGMVGGRRSCCWPSSQTGHTTRTLLLHVWQCARVEQFTRRAPSSLMTNPFNLNVLRSAMYAAPGAGAHSV